LTSKIFFVIILATSKKDTVKRFFMNIKDIELKLAQDFANIRKKLIGKGPEEIQVYIHGDTIFIKVRGLWTPLEQRLLAFLQTNNLLDRFHSSLLDQAKPMIEELLSPYVNVEISVHNISADVFTDDNKACAIILLNKNFEKEIK
jgi:uncharacterized protein YbcI